MRKILFSVIVLLVLLLAVEVGFTLLSQHGLERAMRSQYGLPTSLEVSINSFPYLLSLARNHLGEVRLSWTGDLKYQVSEGTLESLPYEGRVDLYDVELNMPSLLTGKLDIKHISRQDAFLSLDMESLKQAAAMQGISITMENDSLYADIAGEKTRCKVKVTGEAGLTIEPYGPSMDGSGSYSNPDLGLEVMKFQDLPLGAVLLSASLKGERVMLEISIPMWEGYL